MSTSNFWQPVPKKKQPTYTNDSILESLRTIGSGVGKTVTRDVVGRVGSDAVSSLLGSLPKSGELKANESVSLKPEITYAPKSFIRRPEINLQPLKDQDQTLVKQKLDAVRLELKALSSAIKSLNQDVQKSIDQIPVQPGVYHLNFMERLRSILKILREQIEDSRSWLMLSTGRKKKKQFWGLYKKHGTQFGLSSERTLATQAG